jgi:VIT1/CCC1 family predicted Fe2+/Mn2+ transporter
MYDDFGGSLPKFTYIFLKTRLASFLGIFTLVYFSLHFTSWVKGNIRRRRLWVISSFIMTLIALLACTYALYLPIYKMAGAIE